MTNNLDKYQKEAVHTKENHVLVVAPPGSGKTTVIINRTAHLINEKKVHADNMVVITFTKSAAMNMKERYLKLTENNKAPFFGTFHSLFYKILYRHLNNINIISGSEAYKLINGVLVSYLDSVGDEKVKEVLNNISFFKSNEKDMEYFKPKIDKDIFRQCLNTYEDYKREKSLMDFDDLQLNAKKLFVSRPLLLEGYRKLFKYVLVDEFQDCDKLQIELLQMLVEGNSIFAVGDEDQCIYGFRGSRPDCMVDFNQYFKDGKKIFLRTNYRSTENIVNLSQKVIKNNKNRNVKEIDWNKDYNGNINFFIMENEKEQSKNIAESIKELRKNDNFIYSDIAVLYRTNIESRSIVDIFLKQDIPFRLLDKEYNFFDNFICKDILAYLKLSLDVTDRESFIRIINKPFRYISKINIEKVRKNQFKESCFEILTNIEDIPIFQIKNLEKLEKDVLKLNKMHLKESINFVINNLGYYDYIRSYSDRAKIDFEELKDVLEEFKESAEDFTSIDSFLVHIEEIKEQLRKKTINEDGVVLSTIHGVKGMEFRNVFIINCNEGVLPHVNSLPENEEEERRLFYVGMTRAIENLNIYATKMVKGRAKEISRFINECDVKAQNNAYDKKSIKNEYKIGEYVIHKTYGEGKVLYIEDKYISIIFNENIERRFDAFALKSGRLLTKK
jgi:DNA helicase-2/ATP-dependent DNA helicase PcrA